jgi:membrane associated rhomboid family serine protease
VQPFQPPKPARITNAIVLACLAVQLLMTLAGPTLGTELVVRGGLIPARLTGVVEMGAAAVPAPLTLLSSLFIHGGWLHLGLNLVFLLLVGRMVEWVVGPGKLLAIFLIGGVAGGLAQVLVTPASGFPVIGASGAIAAVFAVYATLFARRRANPRRVLGVTVSSEFLTALWFAAVWIGLQLMTGAAFNGGGGGVAIWAHIGGFVAGLILAQPLLRRRQSNLL